MQSGLLTRGRSKDHASASDLKEMGRARIGIRPGKGQAPAMECRDLGEASVIKAVQQTSFRS